MEEGDYLLNLVIQSPPYTMEKLDAREARREGNDRFEGFAVDLANRIASIVGFNLTIKLTDAYGSVDESGHWNGMIRELLEEVRIYF